MAERAIRIGIGVLLVLAGICYSSWVLEFVFETGLDPIHSFLSELEAPDRPYRDWFEYGDVLAGSMSLVAGLTGLVCLPPRRLISTVGWLALAAFGAATFADSQAPVGCVPAPAHPCPDEPKGLLPQLHHLHALTSILDTDWALGVAQRIQIAGMSVWLGTLGVAVWREPVREPATTRP